MLTFITSLASKDVLTMVKRYGLFIGGRWVNTSPDKVVEIINPANQDVIAEVSFADEEDTKEAIMSARDAFENGPWRTMSQVERGKLLLALARAIREHSEELARLESLNCGKPLRESRVDVKEAADCFEFYGGLADKVKGEIVPTPDTGFLGMVFREPIGVIGQIIPWNFPLLIAAWKLAPALAMGNCCVLKPSELTPITALELAGLIKEVGFPDGVVNVVNGLGPVVGMEIARNEYVDKLSFTGSIEVGKQLMRVAAEGLKRISLELGGKSPAIVFDDVNLPFSARWVQFGIFMNQGEVCSATSRLYVHESIYDGFLEELLKITRGIKIGDPLDEATEMGPVISKSHLERVLHYIDLGKKEGAEVLCGGFRLMDERFKRGFFLSPTIFVGCRNDMAIVQEEIFGPVLVVFKFKDEDEAVELANATRYGLGAAVFTRDVGRVYRVVEKLRAGVVWVNSSQLCFVQLPWGGYKQSGIGRELGTYAVEEYTQLKQVVVNVGYRGV